MLNHQCNFNCSEQEVSNSDLCIIQSIRWWADDGTFTLLGAGSKTIFGVKNINGHMMDVYLDIMVAYSIILHSIVLYYIIHTIIVLYYIINTIVDQQWCGVMQIALPFLPHPCHYCTNIINLTCTTERCQQSTTFISPQVCGHWSCKLAHYLLLTCGNAGCQKRAKRPVGCWIWWVLQFFP